MDLYIYKRWEICAKKAQFTHERVEYNVSLSDEPFNGSKTLKIFKTSLTFRFDKLWHLLKSVHTGENSQIQTVSNKKNAFYKHSLCFGILLVWKLYLSLHYSFKFLLTHYFCNFNCLLLLLSYFVERGIFFVRTWHSLGWR
jgi:hypothetical protein